VPLVWLVLRTSGRRVYEDMNQELKRRVESDVARPSRAVGSAQGKRI
jgi:hypothetical protein